MKCYTCDSPLPPELEDSYSKTVTLKKMPFCSVDCYFKGHPAFNGKSREESEECRPA